MNGQMSELEAVNEVLSSVGDQPVQTLVAGTYIEAIRILQILKETSREVQSQGWWFNEEENKKLQPNTSNHIILGNNVIRATVQNDRDGSYIQRGNRLYDRKENTYEFPSTVVVNLLLALDWDELPQVARMYIAARTAVKYNSGYVGLDSVMQSQLSILNERMTLMKISDTESRDVNIFENTRVSNIAFRFRR